MQESIEESDAPALSHTADDPLKNYTIFKRIRSPSFNKPNLKYIKIPHELQPRASVDVSLQISILMLLVICWYFLILCFVNIPFLYDTLEVQSTVNVCVCVC